MAYVAMQDDWAEFAAKFLDSAIVRGRPKAETTIEHLEVEEYKAASSEASRRLAVAAERQEQRLAELEALLATVKRLELSVEERAIIRIVEEKTERTARSYSHS